MEAIQAELKEIRLPTNRQTPLASDDSGNLYTPTPEGYLWKSAVRSNLLASTSKGPKSTTKQAESSRQNLLEIRPRPSIEWTINLLEISPDGNQALVAGTFEEDDTACLAIVDLPASQRKNQPKFVFSESHIVDPDLFTNRPGLEILQVSWHPGSLRHLVVLTSDNVLRVYCQDDLSIAEQSFSLQLSHDRYYGMLDIDLEVIKAFAFAQGEGWHKYTIYLVGSKGSIFMLCPVAPFGSNYYEYEAQVMVNSISREEDSVATISWLQQALPASMKESSVEDSPLKSSQKSHHVQPNCLSSHTIALQGPLPVSSADSEITNFLDLGDPDDSAACLCHTWFSSQCSLLTLASQGGIIGWHLIAHTPKPEWTERTPNCILNGDRILAVKNEVSQCESWAGELLLLAGADLQLESEELDDPNDPEYTPKFYGDPVKSGQWYYVHKHNAFALSAPWASKLAHKLFTGNDTDIQTEINQTSVQELWADSSQSEQCVGSAILGGAMLGSSLLLLHSNGDLQQLQPDKLSLPVEEISEDEERPGKIDEQVNAMYGDILRGPRNLGLPDPKGVGAQQPEGQKILSTSIRVLREKYVEFIHQGRHEIGTRLDATEAGLLAQSERAKQISQALSALQQKRHIISDRLQQCDKFNDNLIERVKLLTELHWNLPHTMSQAEKEFNTRELPRLENQRKHLASELKRFLKQSNSLDKVRKEDETESNKIPASQLRQMRAALLEQSETIFEAQNLVKSIQSELDAFQLSRIEQLAIR